MDDSRTRREAELAFGGAGVVGVLEQLAEYGKLCRVARKDLHEYGTHTLSISAR